MELEQDKGKELTVFAEPKSTDISSMSVDLLSEIFIDLFDISPNTPNFIKYIKNLARANKRSNPFINSIEVTNILIGIISDKEHISDRYAAIILGTTGSLKWFKENPIFKDKPVSIIQAVKSIKQNYAKNNNDNFPNNEILLNRFKENYYDRVYSINGKTCLMLSIEYTKRVQDKSEVEYGINFIKALLMLGADPNRRDGEGKAPINYVYVSKHLSFPQIKKFKKIQDLLIDAGATIAEEKYLFKNWVEELNGDDLLLIACYLENVELLNKALKKGTTIPITRWHLSDILESGEIENLNFMRGIPKEQLKQVLIKKEASELRIKP